MCNKIRLVFLGICLCCILSCYQQKSFKLSSSGYSDTLPPLMPWPQAVTFQPEQKVLNNQYKIFIAHSESTQAEAAAQIFAKQVQKLTKVKLGIIYTKSKDADLLLDCRKESSPYFHLSQDESYQLSITREHIHLKAEECGSLIWGLQTLLQLFHKDGWFPAVEITDSPRFKWRGLLIDVARQWQPIENLKRNIDAMAYFKMNILHLHLSDDQGFRIESKKWPLLHGAGSNNQYYTQEEMRELIAYARRRGVHIISEFDLPAHTSAWFAGYPHLASKQGAYAPSKRWGVHDAVMNPANEKTFSFLEHFFEEMAELFPEPYIHIGGDEVTGHHWETSPEVKTFMRKKNFKNKKDVQNYFSQRLDTILSRHKKIMIGWDEVYGAPIRNESIIQIWRQRNDIPLLTQSSHNFILSHGYYLDHFRSAGYHYRVDPEDTLFSQTQTRRDHLIGGEACIWGEVLSTENLDSRIWPRSAAIAERLWSAKNIRNREDMYTRLRSVTRTLEVLGLRHLKHYDERIKELAAPYSPELLQMFTSLLQPTTKAAREFSAGENTTPMPNIIVEFILAESLYAQHFNHLINVYLENRTSKKEIEKIVSAWHSRNDKMTSLLTSHEKLQNLLPLLEQINKIFKIITSGLQQIDDEILPSEKWFAEATRTIAQAKSTVHGLKVAFISGAEKVINTLKAKATKGRQRQ